MRKLTISILITIYSCALLAPALWQNCKPLAHLINRVRRSDDQFVLVISKQAYAQLKHEEDEMWWNGYLVDIKSVTEKKDGIELVVETDHFETKCINHVSKHKFPKERTALWQWFTKVYTCDSGGVSLNTIVSIATTAFSKNYPLSIAFLHVDCPPPDAA